jgi:ribosomal-protein-alanine N-acetyltransferase
MKGTEGLFGWNGLQYLPDTDEIEIGYILAKPFWNQGLTTEAAFEGLRFVFEELGLDEIVAIIHPENLASQRVAEKLGLHFTRQAGVLWYAGLSLRNRSRYLHRGWIASCWGHTC